MKMPPISKSLPVDFRIKSIFSNDTGISFVGSIFDTQLDGTDMTMSLASLNLQENDLVIVLVGMCALADRACGMVTAGYTEIAELYANDSYDAPESSRPVTTNYPSFTVTTI